jgi:hypothetical protein
MALNQIDIEKCLLSAKILKVKKKVDTVKICTADNAVYTLTPTGSSAFPHAPNPITVGPAKCAGPYDVTETAGSYEYTLAGAECNKKKGTRVFTPPIIIIDVGG